VGKSVPVKPQADHDFPHPRLAVIKQRMQLQSSTYRSVIACAKHVHATEGLRAFYISYPTTLLMNIPLQAVQFSVYEILKSFLNPTGEYSPSTHIAAGGVAGGVAAALTTPLDVAKVGALAWTVKEKTFCPDLTTFCSQTLLQTRGTSNDARIRNARGMAEALKIIVARDGWKGLRRGMSARVVTFAPSTAISWASYEFFSECYFPRATDDATSADGRHLMKS
jgi:solute carrier family 25 iron transporter 28/37